MHVSKKSKRYDLFATIPFDDDDTGTFTSHDELPEAPDGTLFETGSELIDLSNVVICGATVDTVRQIYFGRIKQTQLKKIKAIAEGDGDRMMETPFGQAVVKRMGRASGYSYCIQSNEAGVILFLKSFYKQEKDEWSHVKIELSPHFMQGKRAKDVQGWMRTYASWVLEPGNKPKGVTVHLACDIQGWTYQGDLKPRMITHARACSSYDGITAIEFKGLKEVAVTYGDNEGYLWGKSTALQLSIYRKDIEIIKRDKVDYFHAVWKEHSYNRFDPEKPVIRVEGRIPHNIIREIGQGWDMELESFEQVADYLSDIWRYVMMRNRMMHNATYIDPYWQMMMEDCIFACAPTYKTVKRVKKKDVAAVGRNIVSVVGNVISLAARKDMTAGQVYFMLRGMALWDDIERYYWDRGKGQKEMVTMIQYGLVQRRKIGKAA
ncbi:MAG: hypothetical protein HQL50_09180 [Magnetococcales bacterium]|nr:hypothetical protein [Magnetococcales bacterium]